MNDHPCSECGVADAPFGYGPMGVPFRKEPDRYQWFCRRHRPDRDEETDSVVVERVVAEVEEFECPF